MFMNWTAKQMLAVMLFIVVAEAAVYTGGLWVALLCATSWVLAYMFYREHL